MIKKHIIGNNILFSMSIFLILALLLSTDNGSVVIAGLTVLICSFLIYKRKKYIHIDRDDKIIIACLSAYAISNVPLAILDWGNLRYFRGASRLVLCIPIYFTFKYSC